MSTDEFAGYVRLRFDSEADAFLTIYPARNEAEKTASQLAAFSDEAAWHGDRIRFDEVQDRPPAAPGPRQARPEYSACRRQPETPTAVRLTTAS
jgi:hypothetical protein